MKFALLNYQREPQKRKSYRWNSSLMLPACCCWCLLRSGDDNMHTLLLLLLAYTCA